jgi:hypothetical protein
MRTATIEHLGEILQYCCVDPSRRAVGAQVREFSLEMAVSTVSLWSVSVGVGTADSTLKETIWLTGHVT